MTTSFATESTPGCRPRCAQRILAICQQNLAPNGVAYISYNTYPGWHFRGLVKDIVRFHTRELEDPREKLSEARGLLNFLAESLPEESPYSRVVQSEAKVFQREDDHYLIHEFMEDVNQPMYFYEFMEEARAKGLQYLGEAWFHTRLDNLPERIRETVENISASLIHQEQYLDFLRTHVPSHLAVPRRRRAVPATRSETCHDHGRQAAGVAGRNAG